MILDSIYLVSGHCVGWGHSHAKGCPFVDYTHEHLHSFMRKAGTITNGENYGAEREKGGRKGIDARLDSRLSRSSGLDPGALLARVINSPSANPPFPPRSSSQLHSGSTAIWYVHPLNFVYIPSPILTGPWVNIWFFPILLSLPFVFIHYLLYAYVRRTNWLSIR